MNTQVLIPMKPAAVPAQSFKPAPFGALQRKCACGGAGNFSGECTDCKKKKLQRSVRGSGPETAPPIVHDVLRSSGQPLDGATRAYFEPRFGHDFSRVRIHADARANESAQSVNALAYTVGRNVVFGAGQYQPDAASGRRLLAHELTHVVQQGSFTETPLQLKIGPERDSSEMAAENAAASLGDSEFARPVADAHLSRGIIRRAAIYSGRILDEGTCLDLVAGSKWICCDPANGAERSEEHTSELQSP